MTNRAAPLRLVENDDTIHPIDCRCDRCPSIDAPLTAVDVARYAFYGLIVGVGGSLCLDPAGTALAIRAALDLAL